MVKKTKAAPKAKGKKKPLANDVPMPRDQSAPLNRAVTANKMQDWHHDLCQVTGYLVLCLNKKSVSRETMKAYAFNLRRIAGEFDELVD